MERSGGQGLVKLRRDGIATKQGPGLAVAGREVARPPKELKAFAKVALAPGETRTVELKVKAADLAYWDIAGNGWKLEPGEYRALVGPSSRSEDLLEAGFKV